MAVVTAHVTQELKEPGERFNMSSGAKHWIAVWKTPASWVKGWKETFTSRYCRQSATDINDEGTITFTFELTERQSLFWVQKRLGPDAALEKRAHHLRKLRAKRAKAPPKRQQCIEEFGRQAHEAYERHLIKQAATKKRRWLVANGARDTVEQAAKRSKADGKTKAERLGYTYRV